MNLLVTRNGTLADLKFTATQTAPPSGESLRIQSSATPSDESSWTDLPDGNHGGMNRSTNPDLPDFFLLLANNLPAGGNIFFRAIGSLSGSIDSISNFTGPYLLVADKPPVITITPPNHLSGSGTQADPFVVPAGQIKFSADAMPDPSRPPSKIVKLSLQIDGKTITDAPGAPAFVDYRYTVIGDHVLEGLATDVLGATGRAGTGAVYIRVVPSGDRSSSAARSSERDVTATAASLPSGNTYTLVKDNQLWNDDTSWVDARGKNGVPGPNDLAIVGRLTVNLPGTPFLGTEVGSIVLNGGSIVGSNLGLVLDNHFTIYGGRITDLFLQVQAGALCELLNTTDVAASGAEVRNYGSFLLHGAGGCKIDKFKNYGVTNFQSPISIAPDAAVNPLAGARVLDTAFTGSGLLTGLNPNSLVAQGAG
ncbi:MAG: hypothetical protein M3Z64_05905, partial [Verrucomicrobiota bacterium]|nr:hypothetical protein [Verrucomicrobiota bacterium]